MNKDKSNKITTLTRQSIADQMQLEGLWYHGKLDEPNFLNRLYDLKALPSSPREHRYNNAYDDIYQHTVNNNDWDSDWIYNDARINLLHESDEKYLKFLSETLHPIVRSSAEEIEKLISIYNEYLSVDGFEIIQSGVLSGKFLYSGRAQSIGADQFTVNKTEIKKYLDTAYVRGKVDLMSKSINTDTDLAIGTAKELLETACKSILKEKGVIADPSWSLSRLIRETSDKLDFKPKEAEDPAKAEQSIKQILGGISSIVHGVSELRNAYGSGHGKDADFKGLEAKYAKLLVGVVSEIVVIFLATNGETAELV